MLQSNILFPNRVIQNLLKELKIHFWAIPQNLLIILSSPFQKEYHRLYRAKVILWNTEDFFSHFSLKFSNTSAPGTSTENSIRAKCFELKISKNLIAVFL